ncbi:outer membrane lipoprotein-sorting protein [Psychromonas aquimarina]|uniref:outer membrane lipoprotein-sorting protein n=1 Tax=Psychromonas aquimarina TaxID=444919 RepID=UPI00041AED06|nr:outer membrane lipoprotein-sorting protein [Psychromonas aquimarina]
MHYSVYLVLALLTTQAGAQNTAPEYSQAQVKNWLIKADSYRQPFKSGELKTSLTVYKENKQAESSSFFVQLNESGDSRVTMLDTRSKGQKVLLTESAMWLYIPRTRKAIRITPMQRLMGQASYGDVSSLSWQHEYQWDNSPVIEKQSNNTISICFRVQAARKSATYRSINLCLDKDSLRPVNADFYLASGKLMKQAVYLSSSDTPDMIDQTKFMQPGKSNQHTMMKNTDYLEKQHKKSIFTRQGFIKK